MEEAVDRLAKENVVLENKYDRLKTIYAELQNTHVNPGEPEQYATNPRFANVHDQASNRNSTDFLDDISADDDQFEIETKFLIEDLDIDPNGKQNIR